MNDTSEMAAAKVADMLNRRLGPDGWDIGALEDIAEYVASQGMCVYDHDDPSLDWNQANYEGNDDHMGEQEAMMREFQSLGMEVPLATPIQVEELAGQRDRVLDNIDSCLEFGFYDYAVEFRVDGGATHDAFKRALATLIAGTRNIEYDIKITPKFNPTRFDNQPF